MKRCIKMSERIILHSFHKYQLPVVPKEDISQKNIERMNKKKSIKMDFRCLVLTQWFSSSMLDEYVVSAIMCTP